MFRRIREAVYKSHEGGSLSQWFDMRIAHTLWRTDWIEKLKRVIPKNSHSYNPADFLNSPNSFLEMNVLRFRLNNI